MTEKIQEQLNANLILAARAGNVSAIRESIHSGAQVNFWDHYALNEAVKANSKSAVDVLLSLGANPRANDSKAVVSAAFAGNSPILETLLTHGGEADAQSGFAIDCAIKSGKKACVDLLLVHCKNLRKLLENPETPKLVKALLQTRFPQMSPQPALASGPDME